MFFSGQQRGNPAYRQGFMEMLAVAPGIGFGEFGDDYVRLAIVENEQRIRQAARGVRRFFDQADHILNNVVQIKRPA